MNLSVVDKYGFPFSWFIDKYNELNNDNSLHISDEKQDYIDTKYETLYLNYPKFIDYISDYLKISDKDKLEYLNQEYKCVICKEKYPHYLEKFTNYIDYDSKSVLTEDICYDCVYQKYECMKCDTILNDEPYGDMYLKLKKENKYEVIKLCFECMEM